MAIKLLRTTSTRPGEAPECAGVLDNIDREIQNVQAFYSKVFVDIGDQVSRFYQSSDLLDQESEWEHAGRQELHFILSLLTQCCTSLKTLLRYGTVNSRGFQRLLRKFNDLLGTRPDFRNNLTSSRKHIGDIQSKLETEEFSTQNESLYRLKLIKGSIQAIRQVLSRNSFTTRSSLLLNDLVRHHHSSLGDLDIAYRAIRDDDVAALDFFFRETINVNITDRRQNQILVAVLLQLSIIYVSKACFSRLLMLLRSTRQNKASTQTCLSFTILRILVVMGHRHRRLAADSVDQNSRYIARSTVPTQTEDDDLLSLLSYVLLCLDAKDIQAALLTPDPICNRLPIHYTAQYRLPQACQLLLSRMKDALYLGGLSARDSILLQDYLEISPLSLAIMNGSDEVSRLLLEFNQKDDSMSLIHIWKATSGLLLANAVSSNRKLLNTLLDADPDLDHRGRHGETALYIAARFGDVKSMQLLLSHGAKVDIAEDSYGWTPLIIASLHGYTEVVELLIEAGASVEYRDHFGWSAIDHAAFNGEITVTRMLKANPRIECRSGLCDLGPGSPFQPAEAMRMIQPLHSENLVLVNLVSFELEGKTPSFQVDLDSHLSQNTECTDFEVGLSIEVSLIGSKSPSHRVDLPLLEDLTNQPWRFYANDLRNAKLLVKLYCKRANADKVTVHEHIGSGIALLDALKQSLGPGRESLIRDHHIPILSKEDLENVQLTKDLVPVIYHDFLVSETGTDAWMHNLSLDQRSRSLSYNDGCENAHKDLTERMTHTFEYKKIGFKGNTRGNYIHGPFLTLDDLLSRTPDSIALNVEIKYPMLFEAAEDWKSDTFAIEVNTFVDTILTSILSHPSCQRRPIMLSSFSPEVCILLSLKQNMFPIFFLNESGNNPVGDIRASSVQEAIHFATYWGLDGIIMAADPFVHAPNLVRVAKMKGLVTGSWGALNNEPECAKIQQAAGLDIIIVDAVRLISGTLKVTNL
ncbi:hypothetical protein UA08_09296 [Talaromyces atroroseus]|uniref:GP-PDE domain-containing protein n=1 Tax=Talaromyces atroroseus TaxID=1441469 RepID=A0A1Q5Q6G0_TALAT|nr:hypothetical protein UA08_09296 [Talaromyces atroroseus]OKL55438.1 hypothetical protein UA08_09296 [Talaromyces atroroseus]